MNISKGFEDILLSKFSHLKKNYRRGFLQIGWCIFFCSGILEAQVQKVVEITSSTVDQGMESQVNLVLPQEIDKPTDLQPPANANQNEMIVSQSNTGSSHEALEILNFWFGNLPDPSFIPNKMDLWLRTNPEDKRQIRVQFSNVLQRAVSGELNYWRETPAGRLALILVLDQFSRHLYRNQPQAFASDPMAIGLVLEGLQKGDDLHLYPIERAFFYLPLEHSENMEMQNLAIELYQKLLSQSPKKIKPLMKDFLIFAQMHRDQIARFGRFPHRNKILGRKSTPEELLFLSSYPRRAF